VEQLESLTLELGQIGCSETSVTNYQPTLRTLQKGEGLNVYGYLVELYWQVKKKYFGKYWSRNTLLTTDPIGTNLGLKPVTNDYSHGTVHSLFPKNNLIKA
jgi:hypothetical protein